MHRLQKPLVLILLAPFLLAFVCRGESASIDEPSSPPPAAVGEDAGQDEGPAQGSDRPFSSDGAMVEESGEEEGAPASGDEPPSPAAGSEPAAGHDADDRRVELTVDGRARELYFHVPSSYDGSTALPVVMSLHGSGGSGRNNAKSSRWVEVAEKAGALALFPSALRVCLEREDGREIKPFWQTRGKQQMLCDGQERYEETDFLGAALDWAAERFEIDENRVYVSGFSNGCGLIQQNIIPEMSDRFAAAGCVGSLMRPVSMGGTIHERRGRPIPLFLMIGQRDPHFTGPDDRPLPLSGKALMANELVSGSIGILLELLDLEPEPTGRASDLGHLMTFDRTRDGQGSQQLRFAVMKGVKHSFPTGGKKHNGIVAARVLWKFFLELEDTASSPPS